MPTFTGIVTKVEMRQFDSYERSYNPHTRKVDAKLMVALDTPEGPVWFYSPKADYSICSPPGAGVAVCTVLENDWIGKREAKEEKVVGHYPQPKIEIGDKLAINGRVKKETRFGPQLYYVKMAR